MKINEATDILFVHGQYGDASIIKGHKDANAINDFSKLIRKAIRSAGIYYSLVGKKAFVGFEYEVVSTSDVDISIIGVYDPRRDTLYMEEYDGRSYSYKMSYEIKRTLSSISKIKKSIIRLKKSIRKSLYN